VAVAHSVEALPNPLTADEEILAEAFYKVLDDDVYESTEHTIGPWDATSQHGGPPAALLGRSVERFGGREDIQVARMTLEILGPIPVSPLKTTVQMLRPGKKVELLEASLTAGGKEVVRANAWRIRTAELPIDPPEVPPPAPPPEECELADRFPTDWQGYIDAMEWRLASGTFPSPGPARAWLRMRIPLLPGETPSPLTRVLAAADSGSGLSAALDWSKWVFVNTDLTVGLHRLPAGEWVFMDAATTLQPHGIGLAETEIFDQRGPIGRGQQTLYIAERQ
jgi:hypothetical protein